MKKVLLLLLVFPVVLLTGCQEKENYIIADNAKTNNYEDKSGKVTCILDTKTQAFDLKSTYNISYEKGVVTNVYVREIVDMKNEKYVSDYVKKINEEHEKYSTLDYYEYYVNADGSKVTSVNSIDYSKIDLDLLSEVSGQKIDENYLKVGKYIATYKILGAKCDIE